MDPNDQANLDNGGNSDQNNGGNATPPAWIAQLDGDLQKNERFTQFKTISDMGKTLLDLEGNSVRIPGEKATDEERKAFHSKIGVPDAPDKYELDTVDVKEYTKEADKMFRELMLKSNVPKSAAKGVHKAFTDMIKQGYEMKAKAETDRKAAEQAALDGAVNTLKDTWKGETFKANTELAHRAWKNVISWAGIKDEEGNSFLSDTKIGNLSIGDHPMFLKLFHAIYGKIADDSTGGFRGGNGGGQGSDEDKAAKRFPNTTFKT
jgi:hypothetical protein